MRTSRGYGRRGSNLKKEKSCGRQKRAARNRQMQKHQSTGIIGEIMCTKRRKT